MKTEPSTSSTTPPVLPKRGEPEINPPPFVRGNLAWGVHWPWHKALAVANRIWWYNPLRHTTTEKYTMFMSYMYCFTMINDWFIDLSYLFRLMLLLCMYTGDGAVGVMTMLSLVAPRIVFVTACGATGICGVVTLTAPHCSSVYTLWIYMPSDRGQGRHVYVIYVLLYYY